MSPYREPSKPTNHRLKQFFVDRLFRISPLTVFLAAVLLAGVSLAATAALRVNAVDMPDGTGMSLSATGHGVIKYDNASHTFQASTNGGAFGSFGGGASLSTANTWTASQNVASVPVAYAATININAALGNTFATTLTGNATIANPTNLVSGGTYGFELTQDATGGRTVTWGAAFKWPGGSAPILQTAASAKDLISCYYDGTDLLCGSLAAAGTVTSVTCGTGMSCAPITTSGAVAINTAIVPNCTPTTTGDYCGWNGTTWVREPAPVGGSTGNYTFSSNTISIPNAATFTSTVASGNTALTINHTNGVNDPIIKAQQGGVDEVIIKTNGTDGRVQAGSTKNGLELVSPSANGSVTVGDASIQLAVGAQDWTVQSTGLNSVGQTFANLGTPANGTIQYCSDCTIANPCAGSGTGAFAKRLNGVWVCN